MVAIGPPFTFSDVCLEIWSSSNTIGKSLFGTAPNGAFAQALVQGGTFNGTYVGSKDRLSNFRGYTAGPALAINVTVGHDAYAGYHYYGFHSLTPAFGSVSSNNTSSITGGTSTLVSCYYENLASGGLIMEIANGNSTVPPSGFSMISVDGITYSLAGAYIIIWVAGGSFWRYIWYTVPNSFGTTVGAVKVLGFII